MTMPEPEVGIEAVFKVFCGPPAETVANVNRSLKEYVVVNWNWAVCGDMVVLSALLVSQREVRKAQLAMTGLPGPRQ
jgi:hypothetical protein